MVAAVLVAGLDAGIEPAGGDLERVTAALGEAARFAAKTAARGAIWLAIHRGWAGGERSAGAVAAPVPGSWSLSCGPWSAPRRARSGPAGAGGWPACRDRAR
jgi:hypothetical protein